MTKNVIFDIGGVLIDWNPRHLYSKLLPDDAAIEAYLKEIGFDEWNLALDAGGRWGPAVMELSERLPHRRELIEAAHLRWHEMLPGAIDGTVVILEKLAEKNVPLYAITNYSSEKWAETLARFPFFRHFRDIVVSGDEGIVKPDPALFRLFLDRNGLSTGSCLYIDDKPENVEAAQAVGIHAIVFESPEKLEDDLTRLGILP
jgi:2-haloacid dehalogenase